ncbi:VirK family protein [Methylobacterium sp. 092160098-2]|uniref:VirK family protein n=1 Tax=Methylobacterium sp. 092160098-2 TaxID=3025129 RepID=UPI002381B3F9|nr:VirK family protein [Methylobacterium sp. 092160098-2]MDE4915153.1 VirK family protein [Methylobacterium sp. 092160098-2]
MKSLANKLNVFCWVILPFIICISFESRASDSFNLGDLSEALQAGKNVVVIVNSSRCNNANSGGTTPESISGLRINSFKIIKNDKLLFSDMHQGISAKGNATFEYIRYTYSANKELKLHIEILETGEVKRIVDLTCAVPGGARFVWQ